MAGADLAAPAAVRPLDRLAALGFLPPPVQGLVGAAPLPLDVIRKAIAAYKAFHGLAPSATDEQVAAHLSLPRCGMPDVMAAGLARWPTDGRTPVRLQVWNQLALAGFSAATVRRLHVEALADWQAKCNLSLALLPDGTPAGTPCNVRCIAGSIDGPGSILAQCYLPYEGISLQSPPLLLTVDQGDPWSAANYGEDYLLTVLKHEYGHAWGLGHQPMGTGALMEPFAAKGRGVTANDVAEMEARYGRRAAQPTPDPTPNPMPQPSPSGSKLTAWRDADGATIELWRRA